MDDIIDIVDAIEDDRWPEGMSTCDSCCNLVDDRLLEWHEESQLQYCGKCLERWRTHRRTKIEARLREWELD